MVNKLNKKIILKSIIPLLCILAVFYFFSREDRLFKGWKTEFHTLFRWYFDVLGGGKRILSPGNKVISDATELKTWENPFKYKLLGNTRRSLYLQLCPRIEDYSYSLDLGNSSFSIQRLTKKRTYMPFKRIPQSELKKIDHRDLKTLYKFMQENGIRFYVCSWKDWHKKTAELKSAGFKIHKANKYFLLCSITRKGN